MPQQELFFTQQVGDRRVEVLKTEDQRFAREVFDCMDLEAQKRLWNDLGIADKYEPQDMPRLDDMDGEESLWEELLDAAKEDWNSVSFFVVIPLRYSELDRKNAVDGYTPENTDLVCAKCHQARQAAKGYA